MCQLSKEVVEQILAKGRIYEVGGAVRDRFLGHRPIKDRDYLVTGIPYDALTGILRRFGRVDLVGRSFGVIKFTQYHDSTPRTFDISLPRREYSTGTGHRDFDVEFDPNLPVEADLVRRDFTINAMAIALPGGELIDPLEGMVDLKNRCLRMTSPTSFPEDPLRMLRAVQFSARFGFEIEPSTLAAMTQHHALIHSVSAERIAEELNKLLEKAENPSHGFRLMQKTGLLAAILPELDACVGVEQPGGYHRYDVFEHTLHVLDACPMNLRLRMAALFHDINKPQHRRLTDTGATFYGHETSGAHTALAVLKRLRYPRDFAHDVAVLVERHMFTTAVTDKGMRRLVRRVGQELIFDLLDLRRADVVGQGMGGTTEDVDEFERNIREELERKPPFGLNDLAINGIDVMTILALKPSRQVGDVLNYLLEKVLDNPEDNTRQRLIELARDYHESGSDINDSDKNEGTN
ncbi:MAG: HD domain-containing protein [candidate division Zixibacteria bacterium]|jgi:tRNA nucleotidyltransferase (CCA-adding enzyme)|nr:HD domain-containing protein [candidate division Zixibacteria bacterium]